jgi:hypothetical protein
MLVGGILQFLILWLPFIIMTFFHFFIPKISQILQGVERLVRCDVHVRALMDCHNYPNGS